MPLSSTDTHDQNDMEKVVHYYYILCKLMVRSPISDSLGTENRDISIIIIKNDHNFFILLL